MKKKVETITFYQAEDGTKFFDEAQCDKYEKDNSNQTLMYLRKRLMSISSQLSNYKLYQLPRAEEELKEYKKNFDNAVNTKNWLTVTAHFERYAAKKCKRDELVKRYKALRKEANELIARKEEIIASKGEEIMSFDEMFGNSKLPLKALEDFKNWMGPKRSGRDRARSTWVKEANAFFKDYLSK